MKLKRRQGLLKRSNHAHMSAPITCSRKTVHRSQDPKPRLITGLKDLNLNAKQANIAASAAGAEASSTASAEARGIPRGRNQR